MITTNFINRSMQSRCQLGKQHKVTLQNALFKANNCFQLSKAVLKKEPERVNI